MWIYYILQESSRSDASDPFQRVPGWESSYNQTFIRDCRQKPPSQTWNQQWMHKWHYVLSLDCTGSLK